MAESIDTKIGSSMNWRGFFSCFMVALGTVAFGYPSAIIAPTLAKASFLKYMGLGDEEGIFSHKEGLAGALTAVFQAGAVVGVLCGSFIFDKYGRKVGLLYCSILSIIGAAGVTASQNVRMMIAFRFFQGGGSYAFLSLTPSYTSELAPPQRRGLFVGMCGVFLGLGFSSASFFGLGFHFTDNQAAQWRAPLGIGLLWPCLMLILSPFIPESPRYLLMNDKSEEAWEIVSHLHSSSSDPDKVFARAEFYQMKRQADLDRTLDASWRQMFKRPSYRKRLLMAAGLNFLAQSSAVLVINNYGPMFYAALGFNTRDQLILHSGRDSIAFLGNIIGAAILDHAGRRRMLLVSYAGCLVCLCIVSAMVAEFGGTDNKAGLGVGVAALYVYLVFFAIGVDAPTYVYMGEIFPSHIRAKGLAGGITTYALIAIVYLQVAPAALARIEWKFFMVFVALTTLGWLWLYFQLFETKGIPLEEMATKFGDDHEVVVYLKEAMENAENAKPQSKWVEAKSGEPTARSVQENITEMREGEQERS